MARTRVMLFFLVFLLAVPRDVVQAASFSCKGGIISSGDSRTDLIMKCGEPERKDSHSEEIIERLDKDTTRKLYVTVEEWTYNLGPREFMRIVTLKNGTVADIRTGGYGYSRQTGTDQRECGGRVISVGDVKGEVLAKCGEPTAKDSRQEELRERIGEGQEHRVFVTIEEWTYDFGPNRFMRIITFRNGTVSDVRTGGYGYQRDGR